jgi:hypothetical protein
MADTQEDQRQAAEMALASGDAVGLRQVLTMCGGVNARDDKGMTMLHRAALSRRTDAVRTLVELGADKEAPNSTGMTPLHCAAFQGDADVVTTLIRKSCWD